jgi:hypothetical protein
VAEAVVDGLEPVEVEHQHGGHVTAEPGVGHGLVDALGQEGAVGEVGQRVVEGEALQLAVGVGELAGALGHPPFEVLVERFQLLGQHVDADDHRVDVVRGRAKAAGGRRVRPDASCTTSSTSCSRRGSGCGVAIGTHREGAITFRRRTHRARA